MLRVCLIVLAAGLACLIVEMFLAGFGVFGIAGIALMVAAAVIAVVYLPYGWVIVAAEVLLLVAVGCMFYFFIKRRKLQGNLVLSETLNDDAPMRGDISAFVGMEGVVRTVLRPFGTVDFGWKVMEVTSDGPYLDKGARVVADRITDGKIVVRESSENGKGE
ncbi:MAG: hypothetical protein FWF03_08340 [Defluviitaleaceae bacterium]|nr:hypothetical protein [Defluviitaleaceae bacterium]